MRAVKLITLFVLLGGSIGALTTWAVLVALSVFSTESFQAASLVSFFSMLPLVLFVGVVLALLPATATAWIYLSVPGRQRTYINVALAGAATSLLMGCYVAFLIWEGSSDLQTFLGVLAVFAVSGAAAAMTCHSFAKRWPEFEAGSSDAEG